jgi:hypothetical protein
MTYRTGPLQTFTLSYAATSSSPIPTPTLPLSFAWHILSGAAACFFTDATAVSLPPDPELQIDHKPKPRREEPPRLPREGASPSCFVGAPRRDSGRDEFAVGREGGSRREGPASWGRSAVSEEASQEGGRKPPGRTCCCSVPLATGCFVGAPRREEGIREQLVCAPCLQVASSAK